MINLPPVILYTFIKGNKWVAVGGTDSVDLIPGTPGSIGPQGATGATGISNVAGPPGPRGPEGPSGSQGGPGPTGPPGSDGGGFNGGTINSDITISGPTGGFFASGLAALGCGSGNRLELRVGGDVYGVAEASTDSVRFKRRVFCESTTSTGQAANVNFSPGGQLRVIGSSIRYKTDVIDHPEANATNFLNNARPVHYLGRALNTDDQTHYYGFIAEEMHIVDPQYVVYNLKVLSQRVFSMLLWFRRSLKSAKCSRQRLKILRRA